MITLSILDIFSDFLGNMHGVLKRSAWQDNGKFFTSKAGTKVTWSFECILELLGHFSQALIPFLMTVMVIIRLE